MIHRRSLFAGLAAALAAPAIIRTAGLLMPVKPVLVQPAFVQVGHQFGTASTSWPVFWTFDPNRAEDETSPHFGRHWRDNRRFEIEGFEPTPLRRDADYSGGFARLDQRALDMALNRKRIEVWQGA